MGELDKYLIQLRRELTRSQARLSRAERQRDRLLAENAELRQRLTRSEPRPAAANRLPANPPRKSRSRPALAGGWRSDPARLRSCHGTWTCR